MNEQKKTLSFEASYTLDILGLLDLLFSGEMSEDMELIRYFEEQVGEIGELPLTKARKYLPKDASFSSLLIPLITADPEFNDLRVLELLQSPKYLVNQFKKQAAMHEISKTYFKFLNKDLEKVLPYLSQTIQGLERAKFKSFWLEKRLPLVNEKIKQFSTEAAPLNVLKTVNENLSREHTQPCSIYVVSFMMPDLDSIPLFNGDLVISTARSTAQMLEDFIEPLIEPLNFSKRLKARVKMLKGDKWMSHTLRQVKEDYKDLGSYLEANAKLAYKMKIYKQLGICPQPYEYLGRYQFGTYKISALFYHYMETHPKSSAQSVTDYLIEVVERVELDQFEQRFMSLISRTL